MRDCVRTDVQVLLASGVRSKAKIATDAEKCAIMVSALDHSPEINKAAAGVFAYQDIEAAVNSSR